MGSQSTVGIQYSIYPFYVVLIWLVLLVWLHFTVVVFIMLMNDIGCHANVSPWGCQSSLFSILIMEV